MSIVINALVAMGSKLLTAKLVEEVTLYLVEELVKRSKSKADDKLLAIVKENLGR